MKYTNDLRAITDIVDKINRSENEIYFVEKCEKLFSALETIVGIYIGYARDSNKLSEWAKRQAPLSINSKISETINSILTSEQKIILFECTNFKEIIHFRPLIMSDEVLQNNRYNPEEISEDLKDKASETHRNLIESYNYRRRNNDILVTKLSKLLYGVRSNLKHYGKTPFGPDIDKSKRDESICKLIHPILLQIIDILLEEPSKKLLIYGTLKSGQPNSQLLDELRSENLNASIWGFVEEEENLPFFTFTISSLTNKISVELIINNSLPKHFDKLDRFEGEKYVRLLIPYEYNGAILIGNIYAKKPNR
jgi:gamma-glutamylcyclotransferase (GGCT)/AIG2-like uncharacterized protein YtfP